MDHKVLLKGESLVKRFGGMIAVNDVAFEVHSGEILAVIGPNGAGKSVLFSPHRDAAAGVDLFDGQFDAVDHVLAVFRRHAAKGTRKADPNLIGRGRTVPCAQRHDQRHKDGALPKPYHWNLFRFTVCAP